MAGSQKKNTTATKSLAQTAKSNSKDGVSKDESYKSGSSVYGTNKNYVPVSSKPKSSSQKKEKTLDDLFEEELKDMYSAEKQLVEALPKMAEAAYSEDLRDAFNTHLQQTKRHVERIEKVFDRLKMDREEEKCLAMEGLIKEGEKIIEEFEPSHVRDSALIIGLQKIGRAHV